MSEENELVVVYAGAWVEAALVKNLLEGHGIAAFLKDEMMGSWFPWYVAPGGVGPVKVVVARRHADKAKTLVKNLLHPESA